MYICDSLNHEFLMDELSLLLDGIEVKLKKLILQNKGLREKIQILDREKHQLQESITTQKAQMVEMEQQIVYIQAAKVLGVKDSDQAKQKVEELLREIEKCYELLNSQVQ